MGFWGLSLVVAVTMFLLFMAMGSVSGIGANWGTQATHPLPPSTVVKLLKDNGFQKVKLFDADSTTLDALTGSGLQVMVGIPNDMLYTLANSIDAAESWVEKNVSVHVSSNKVDIRTAACRNTRSAISLPSINTSQPTCLTTEHCSTTYIVTSSAIPFLPTPHHCIKQKHNLGRILNL